jgi:hypothetical protein
LKTLQFGQKSLCEVGAKEEKISADICTHKKKSTTLHWDNRTDALRASQE